VHVAPFRIGPHAVCNADFATFVGATGHLTTAEREGFGGLLPDDLPPSRAVAGARWWRQVPGASWQRPAAATSDFAGREDPPVVKVSWLDAREYCRWTSTPAGTCGSGVPTGSGASARVNRTCAGVRTSATILLPAVPMCGRSANTPDSSAANIGSGWRLTCNPSTTQSAERIPDGRHAGPHPVLAA